MKKVIFILLVIALAACSAQPKSEVEKNRQTWLDAKITHYRFSLHIGCFCAFRSQMPLSVEVKDGSVISITDVDGSPIAADDPNYEYFSRYATIERVFDILEAGLNSEAEEVTVTYDPAYGFPSEIYFDYIKAAADDELSLNISNVEVLP